MLLRVVMVMVMVMVSQASHDSNMYSECVVRKNAEIITFEDSVKFWFVKTSNDDFQIKVEDRIEITLTMLYKNIKQYEWLEAELKLSGVPELYIQGKLHNFTGPNKAIKGRRKTVNIVNADVLLACPQGWPNRELFSSAASDVRVPSSGKKEHLVLMPTVDTKVSFTVSGNKRILCLNSSLGVTVVDGKTEAQCNALMSNSAVTLKFVYEGHSIKVLDTAGHLLENFTTNGAKDLRFLRDDLKGPVYIAQCIDASKTATPPARDKLPSNKMIQDHIEPAKDSCKQDLDTLSTVLMVLLVVVVVLLLLLFCYVINLRRQKQPETTYMSAGNNIDHDAGNHTGNDAGNHTGNDAGNHTGNAADAVYNGRKVDPEDVTNTGDALETTNDIYVPYDETLQLRVNYLPNAQK